MLALQEVGPDDVLDRLHDRLTHQLAARRGRDSDGHGIRVALLPTRPLADPTTIRPLPDDVRPVQLRDPGSRTLEVAAPTDVHDAGMLAAHRALHCARPEERR